MAEILINNCRHYYQQIGRGPTLVFVHGAFADCRLWDPQWEHFSRLYKVLRYDLRGHGRTGASSLDHYSMHTYADDLRALLDALDIDRACICGLSWGGSIAQTFGACFPDRLQGLILSGSTAAMSLTVAEKLIRYVLFPQAAMRFMIRTLSTERYISFSLWLAGMTLGRDWLAKDPHTLNYLREGMAQIDQSEYLKIWEAIYGFDLQPLERITCPTLVVNGDKDTRMVIRHSKEILLRIPQAKSMTIAGGYHALPVEEPGLFNQILAEFLSSAVWPKHD